MKTFLKVVAGIFALFLIIAIGLNLYFTDARLKATIMPYVDEAVGRPVQVESMSVTFFSTFPQPGISIEKMSVPGDTESDTLMSLQEVVAGVELFSLFGDEIQISEIRLNRPRFTYRVYEDGSTNIDFLLTEEEADTASGTTAISIPYFTVTNGQFGYEDAASNTAIRMQDFNANVSLRYGELIESSVDVEVGGLYAAVDGTAFLNGMPMSLSEESTIDMENEIVSLSRGTFSIRALALDLSGEIRNWSSTTALNLKFTSSSDNFGELLGLIPESYVTGLGDIETRGSLAIDGSVTGEMGEDTQPDFNASISVKDGYLKYASVPEAIQQINIEADASREAVNIRSMSLKAADNTFSMQGTVSNPMDESSRTVDLETDLRFDLATIKNFYPIDEDTLAMRGLLTAQATLKGKADRIERSVQSGSINLSNGMIDYEKFGQPFRDVALETVLEGNRLTVVNAGFKTGDNNMKASGLITDYLSDNPKINLQLDGHAELAEITSFYDLEPNISKLTGTADMSLKAEGPMQDPAQMSLSGGLTVNDMNMEGEALSQPVKQLNGELNLSPLSANLKNLSFQFGSSDLKLSGSLQHYMKYLKAQEEREVVPQLTGTFESRFFNMDELIDWEDTTETGEILIELPHLTSSVTASIDKLMVTGVDMYNLQARAGTTPKQIRLEQASIEMFEGTATGAFSWSVPRPDRSTISFKGSLDSLRAESFFSEYPVLGKKSNFHEYVSGAFSTDVTYSSVLDSTLTPVIATTKMNGTFGMTKSRLKGHPVQEEVADFIRTKEFRNIALDEWKSSFTVNNSVLTLKDLRLTSGDIGLELDGTQHLVNGTVDYKMSVYLPPRFKKGIAEVITQQAADALTQENGTIMVPLHVSGTINEPKVRLNEAVVKPIIQKYLQDKAGNVLKKLFGGNK